MSTRKKLIIFIIALLVIDQVVKIWIKTHMMIGDEFSVFGNWFKIHFIENNGMAFGMELGGGKWGKTVLSVFRLVAVVGIAWYLGRLIKEKAPMGVILSFGLIFCGAVGNIIDSAFYGMIFSDSYSQVAILFPHGEDIPRSCTGRWLICSTSRFTKVFCLNGFPSGEVISSCSSDRYLTWLTPILP